MRNVNDIRKAGLKTGYHEYLAALKDQKHPEHKEIREWMGRGFDPEKFELEKINKVLNRF